VSCWATFETVVCSDFLAASLNLRSSIYTVYRCEWFTLFLQFRTLDVGNQELLHEILDDGFVVVVASLEMLDGGIHLRFT
jgi:hypothetical protein